MENFIDLSHTIEHGMVTYKGLPAPIICDFLSREDSKSHYASGTEFQIGKIEMVANTGTYIDAPFHRYPEGIDIAELPLESLAGLETVVVRATDRAGISVGVDHFRGLEFSGKAVLVHTGWDKYWRTDQYFQGHAHLTGDASIYLREQGAALVGIDFLNIDDTSGGARPVHTTLLGADIPIVEHMTNLGVLPDTGARLYAVPVKVRGMGSFPVRVFATVPEPLR